MLKYDTRALLKNNESYYSLVIAVAKRAREIAEQAEEDKRISEGKPVKMAIDELMSGDYAIVENPPAEDEE